jgi:hypothetical protein
VPFNHNKWRYDEENTPTTRGEKDIELKDMPLNKAMQPAVKESLL